MPKSPTPERTCVGCYQQFPQTKLIRVVRTPDGEIKVRAPGDTAKISGRGVYLCANEACFKKAGKKKGRKKDALSYWLKENVGDEIISEISSIILKDDKSL